MVEEAILSSCVIENLSPLGEVRTESEAIKMLDLDIAKVCFFHNALAGVGVLNKDDNTFRLLDGGMYFPDVFNDMLRSPGGIKNVTISNFFDKNGIDVLDGNNLVNHKGKDQCIISAIENLEAGETLPAQLFTSKCGNFYYSFLCKRRADGHIQFVFLDVSAIIRQQKLSRENAGSIISALKLASDESFVFELRKAVADLSYVKEEIESGKGDFYTDKDVLNLVMNIQNIAQATHSNIVKILDLASIVSGLSDADIEVIENNSNMSIDKIVQEQGVAGTRFIIEDLEKKGKLVRDVNIKSRIPKRDIVYDRDELLNDLFGDCENLQKILINRILEVRNLLNEIDDSIFVYAPQPKKLFILNGKDPREYDGIGDFIKIYGGDDQDTTMLKRILSTADKTLVNSSMWIGDTFYDIMARPIKKNGYQCTFTKRDVVRVPDEKTETHALKGDLHKFINISEFINNKSSLLEYFEIFNFNTLLDDMDGNMRRLDSIRLGEKMIRKRESISYWIRKVSEIENVSVDIGPGLAGKDFEVFPDRMKNAIEELVRNATHYGATKIKIVFIEKDNRCLVRVIDNGVGIERSRLKEIRQNIYENKPNRSTRESGTGFGLKGVGQAIKSMKGGSISINSRIENKEKTRRGQTVVELGFDID